MQCGFCIPGMVLCAKALLDRTPDPTEEQIRWAIRNNYCRCTGYVKIVEAIRLAGKILREKKIPLPATTDWKIGSRVQRLDVEEKVLGTGKYPDDYYPEKMCYGSAVRSKYPRARVLSIDTSKAAALPGVICVLTAADVPGENIIGHIVHDWDVMVPVGGVVHFLGDGIRLYTTDQSAHTTLHEVTMALGLPPEKVKIQNALVGGGFGGKEDMTVQPLAALIAYKTGRAVKCKLTRAESLLIHPKRHPFEMDFTMGVDENGIIQGVKAKVVSDTGAYASLGGPVLERACTHAAGPYAYENFEIDGYAYYTNNPPAGAFRGFGVTQTCFAVETLLNRAADLVGISPWEIRYRNAIRPGGVLPNGQIVDDSTGLVETLLAVKDEYDNAKVKGIACAMKNAGLGVGLPDWGRCKLIVEGDSKVHIYSGASCIGQGLGTVLVQMVCSNTNLSRDDIVYERSNTWIAPDSGDTSGSRQTLVTGEACRRACLQLHEALAGKSLSDLIGKEFYGEYLAKTDPLGADVPNPVSHVAYGYATQVCILDEKTGLIRKMIAAHDVGKAINPLSCEGQIEGGVVMSMGYALTEQYPIDENCRPTARFGTLGLFRAHQVPEIKAIVIDKPGLNVACGAIGIGEITSIPTAPAIADAYYRLDGEPRTSLPLTGTPYARK